MTENDWPTVAMAVVALLASSGLVAALARLAVAKARQLEAEAERDALKEEQRRVVPEVAGSMEARAKRKATERLAARKLKGGGA